MGERDRRSDRQTDSLRDSQREMETRPGIRNKYLDQGLLCEESPSSKCFKLRMTELTDIACLTYPSTRCDTPLLSCNLFFFFFFEQRPQADGNFRSFVIFLSDRWKEKPFEIPMFEYCNYTFFHTHAVFLLAVSHYTCRVGSKTTSPFHAKISSRLWYGVGIGYGLRFLLAFYTLCNLVCFHMVC